MTHLRAESICDNKEIIERNIRSVKISSPDVRSFPSGVTWATDRVLVPRVGSRQGNRRLLWSDTKQRRDLRDDHGDQLAVHPHLQCTTFRASHQRIC